MKFLVLICLLSLSCTPRSAPQQKTFLKVLDGGTRLEVTVKPWPPSGGRSSIFAYYPFRVGGPAAFKNLQVRAVKDRSSSSMYETMSQSEDRTYDDDGPGQLEGYEYEALDYQLASGKLFLQLRTPPQGGRGAIPVAEWELDVP
jgi:hypothetical protein